MGFDDVSNQVALGQNIAHTVVCHGYPVTGGRHIELGVFAALHQNAFLHLVGQLVEVIVPGRHLGMGVGDGDQWPLVQLAGVIASPLHHPTAKVVNQLVGTCDNDITFLGHV